MEKGFMGINLGIDDLIHSPRPAGLSIPLQEFSLQSFIYPYFVAEGIKKKEEIVNFPGIYRVPIDSLIRDIAEARKLGINNILLFGIPRRKDRQGEVAYAENNIVAVAVKKIKKEFKDLTIITDVCLCAYTTHGHCGVIKNLGIVPSGDSPFSGAIIDNEKTLKALTRVALSHAQAGADWVAPSAMAEKQVAAIRQALDKDGFQATRIMGYSAKFASNFYGPFREAAGSAPSFGDRSSYQLNFSDRKRALKEIKDDIQERADMVMVKPAYAYLDIIREAKNKFHYPLAAYNVSGEYAFVKYGVRHGLWDEKKMVFELMAAIKRAGADVIITYHAKDIARWLGKK